MKTPDLLKSPRDMDNEDLAKYIMNLFYRTVVHYAMWYSEVRNRISMEKAFEIMDEATTRGMKIQIERLSKNIGFELKSDLPAGLISMPRDSLLSLLESVSVNWLVNDGVWFQAVEFAHGMEDAKHCNDSAWAQFSPFEAWTIKKLLNLPERPGLDGLKKALGFRLYANINIQSIIEESEDSFVFQMNDCRVQSARKRKGLEDYPCKSGGIVEYTYFARTIDDRITTECIGCPPDEHPEEWYCSWRFILKNRE